MQSLKIGFIGNFIPPFSTENDRKSAFEKLGHTVITFQENETTSEQLREAATNLDALFYSHTHDPAYCIDGLKNVFAEYKEAGIPTASAHLDRWVGLARVSDVGSEATWYTEYIFMADGSPEAQKLYTQYNLKWYWLKPAVNEDSCYLAPPDRVRFPHDVIFVGSRGYHPEYPQRPELVDFLAKYYHDSFAHYGNDGIRVVRGHDLNVLYASAKVVVGDSCFSGSTENYWSDRIPETTGRGGVLLHPPVKGLDHKGIIYYENSNLDDLKEKINEALEDDTLRAKCTAEAYDWTKSHATYTHRAKEMLEIMGLQ